MNIITSVAYPGVPLNAFSELFNSSDAKLSIYLQTVTVPVMTYRTKFYTKFLNDINLPTSQKVKLWMS